MGDVTGVKVGRSLNSNGVPTIDCSPLEGAPIFSDASCVIDMSYIRPNIDLSKDEMLTYLLTAKRYLDIVKDKICMRSLYDMRGYSDGLFNNCVDARWENLIEEARRLDSE